MASQRHPVKCRRCGKWVPILYYDSPHLGFLCNACHQEMMEKRALELRDLKRRGAERLICGQCGARVSGLYFEARINRFICIDCKAGTRMPDLLSIFTLKR